MGTGAGLVRDMVDAETAGEWLRAWGPRAFRCGRAQESLRSAMKCASLCGERRPVSRDGFLDAARVLRDAIERAAVVG